MQPAGDARPLVSVVMPVRNEGAFIERSLGAVLDQDYPTDRLEVIVVDGQSTDDTRERVEALMGWDVEVTLLDNPAGIVPAAMNIGIRAARGEIIVRVDGHTVIAHDYVSQAVAALSRTGAHNVGGLMTAVSAGRVARAVAAATSSPFGVGGAVFHYAQEEQEADTVYLGCYPKWVLEHVGLYDEEMVRNQDDELNLRLRKAGGRIVLVPLLKSSYHPRSSFAKLATQYFQYGFWKVRVAQKHPRQLRLGHLAPAAFVSALVGGSALGCLVPPLLAPWGAMVATWSGCAAVASTKAAQRHGWDLLPLLPLTFLTLHVSYGAGFLAGLGHFAQRWRELGATVAPLPPVGAALREVPLTAAATAAHTVSRPAATPRHG